MNADEIAICNRNRDAGYRDGLIDGMGIGLIVTLLCFCAMRYWELQ